MPYRPIVNVIVGKLTGEQEKESFLINLKFLDGNENSERIVRAVQETFEMYHFNADQLKVFITDGKKGYSKKFLTVCYKLQQTSITLQALLTCARLEGTKQ